MSRFSSLIQRAVLVIGVAGCVGVVATSNASAWCHHDYDNSSSYQSPSYDNNSSYQAPSYNYNQAPSYDYPPSYQAPSSGNY